MGVSAILLPFYCGILRLSILTVNYNAYLNYLYPKYLKSFEELQWKIFIFFQVWMIEWFLVLFMSINNIFIGKYASESRSIIIPSIFPKITRWFIWFIFDKIASQNIIVIQTINIDNAMKIYVIQKHCLLYQLSYVPMKKLKQPY